MSSGSTPGTRKFVRESDVDEKVGYGKQDMENKILSGEFRWMRRTHRTDPEEGTCSIADSSMDDISRISGIDTYSDRSSSSGLDMSEQAIHTLLVELEQGIWIGRYIKTLTVIATSYQVKESLTTQQMIWKK